MAFVIQYTVMELTEVNSLTVIIGNSPFMEQIRRVLVQQDEPHAGVVSHLQGLRRLLVERPPHLVVLCVSLDTRTLGQYGWDLRNLILDSANVTAPLRSIGLLTDQELSREVAEYGFNVYLDHTPTTTRVVQRLIAHWRAGIPQLLQQRWWSADSIHERGMHGSVFGGSDGNRMPAVPRPRSSQTLPANCRRELRRKNGGDGEPSSIRRWGDMLPPPGLDPD